MYYVLNHRNYIEYYLGGIMSVSSVWWNTPTTGSQFSSEGFDKYLTPTPDLLFQGESYWGFNF